MTLTAPPPPAAPPEPARARRLLPAAGPRRTLAAFALGAVLLFAVAPLALTDFRLGLLAKYLCTAIVAVGVCLAWGRGGLLTLGQGVFFGLGGYAMAMHLKLADAGPGNLPDFMVLYGTTDTLPWWWVPFANPVFALAATVLLPMGVAALLGSLIFRRRVRGAYFALLSQALTAAFAIWLVGQQATTGGTNGLTDIQGFFGYALDDPANQRMVYFVIALVLLALIALARQLIHSRYGELLVAVRDSEERVRFLGYDPARVKLVVYVVAAGMAGLAGALFVPAVGIISPSADRHRPLDRAGDRRGRRRPGQPARRGARRARRGLGEDGALRGVPGRLDLLPGAAVRGGGRLPAGRPRLPGQNRTGTARPAPYGRGRGRRGAEGGGGMSGTGTESRGGLEISGLRVEFDGFTAVDGVDLSVAPGDLRFLIGPNGAGKTTLVDAVTGLARATGSVRFEGAELLGRPVHRIARAGVGRTFQTATVFENLTVLQNLDIAAGCRTLRRHPAAAPQGRSRGGRRGAGDDRADRAAGVSRRGPRPRAEAVAGDRHAAGPERAAAAPGRAGGRR